MFYLIYLSLAFALFLSGCGNPDYGKGKILSGTSAARAAPTGSPAQDPADPLAALAYGPCVTMTIFDGSNPALAQTLAGSSACASTSNPSAVRVKVSANVPPGTRLCLVPMNSFGAYNGSCFSINGQAHVMLSTNQYNTVVLLHETNLTSYMSFLNGQTNLAPARAFAQVR